MQEEGDEMEEDEEESETCEGGCTKSTPIEVVEDVVEPQEVIRPVEAKQKTRVEVATT